MRLQTLLLLFLFPAFLYAQEQELFISAYFSHNEGLSSSGAETVIKDRNGYLWVATKTGIDLYDGFSFSPFKSSNLDISVEDMAIEAFVSDASDRIWCAARNIKQNQERIFFTIDPLTHQVKKCTLGVDILTLTEQFPQTIPSQFARFLPQLSGWTSPDPSVPPAKGYARMISEMSDPVNKSIANFENAFRSITVTSSAVWFWFYPKYFAGHNQYGYYDPQKDTLLFLKLGADFGGIPSHPYFPIDRQNRFWFPNFSSTAGHPAFNSFQLPPGVSFLAIQKVIADNLNNIWLISNDKTTASIHFEYTSQVVSWYKYLDVYPFSPYTDDEGIIWLPNWFGLWKVIKPLHLFKSYLHKPRRYGSPPTVGNSIRTIIQTADGGVFATSLDQKIFYMAPGSGDFEPFDLRQYKIEYEPGALPIDLRADHATYDRDGMVWLGLHNTLMRIDPYRKEARVFPWNAPPDSWEIAYVEDTGGDIILLKKGDQLYFFNKSTGRFSIPAISSETKGRPLVIDKVRQVVILGQPGKVLELDLKTLKTRTIEFQNKTDFNTGVFVGNTLWLCSDDGLYELDRNAFDLRKIYSKGFSFPHKTFFSIVPDGDVLWLGTQNGLCCFNPATQAVKNFFTLEGLANLEFNYRAILKAKDGKIWMGGLNGIDVFDPEKLRKPTDAHFHLFLTNFTLYNSVKDSSFRFDPINITDKAPVAVSHIYNSFSIGFALNSFLEPQKNKYNFYLEGYERPWLNNSDRPEVTYRNLKPGDYFFHVKASNYEGNPASNELVIPIRVLRAWYWQWWAMLLYVCALLSGIYFVYRFQLNKNLIQQEAIRLKELDTVKTRLYTNITHEFRTPLTVILGMAERIESGLTGQGEKEKFANPAQLILRNGKKLLLLINQMLDLSKVESGAMEVHLVQGNIIVYLKYIFESFQALGSEKNIQLHFLTELEDLQMDFDSDKFQKILSNLLINAIKFTPPGGNIYLQVAISGTLSKSAMGDPRLLIKIKDTGIGIPKESLPYIFDRFYMVEDSANRRQEGTGIGLALVKELVSLLKGSIRVSSKPDEGTEFTLEFPIENQVSAEADAALVDAQMMSSFSSSLTGAAHSTNFTNPENIPDKPMLLVIEDNRDVQEYLLSCVQPAFSVIQAFNGNEGIEKALLEIPDIIICDVMMPGKNGFEVVDTLKKDERTSHIPIIILTAKADDKSRMEGLERGAEAYLTKPFDKKELDIRLRKLVELRHNLQMRFSGDSLLREGPLPKGLSQETIEIEDAFLKKVNSLIEKRIGDPDFGTPHLCKGMGLSRTQLYRKLKALTGESIAIYIRTVRLKKGMELLLTTQMTVAEIAYQVGFTDPAYFSRTFSELYNISPSETRK